MPHWPPSPNLPIAVATMSMIEFEQDEQSVETVTLALPLDGPTVTWLARLAGGNDAEAARIIASMLRDIRIDDETAHNPTRH
jgi:hypothetical protein